MAMTRLAAEISGMAHVLPPLTFMQYLRAMIATAPTILKSKKLVSADRMMLGEVTFRARGSDIVLNCEALDRQLDFDKSSAFSLAREIFGRDVYLRAFEDFDAKSEVILDVGANRGIFSVLAAATLTPIKIISIEPEARYRPVLGQLCAPYSATTKITPIVGFAGGQPIGNSGGGKLSEAPIVDLNSILTPGERVALAKIDIEGAEQSLFSGDTNWLKSVDRVTMEVHPQFCNTTVVFSVLESLGFTAFSSDAIGNRTEVSKAEFFYAARMPAHLKIAYRS